MGQPLWKIVWRLLKNLKIELLYDLAISLLCILQKEKSKTLIQKKKNTCTAMFIAALFTIAKDMETIKKNEILPFVTTQKDLDGIMLSVVSQTNTVSLIYGI